MGLIDRRVLLVDGNGVPYVASGGGGGGGGAMTVADGADVCEGFTTDAAVVGDVSGTVSAKLRGLNKIWNSVWDSANSRIKTDGSGVIQPVSGTVTGNQGTAAIGSGAWPVAITDTSNVIVKPGDAGNNAIRVAIVAGESVGVSQVDRSAFTDGTSAFSPIGGLFNDSATSPSSGQAASARITGFRAVHTNLRTAVGTEIGTVGSPLATELSDGAAFYTAAKTGQFPAALVSGRLDVNIGAGSISATQGTSPWVCDTELPAAAALSDAFANPTAPAVGAFRLGWDSVGSIWRRSAVDTGGRQYLGVPTATGNITANGQAIVLNVNGAGFCYLQITGAWTGTISFQSAADGVTYAATRGWAVGTGVISLSTTVNGQWRMAAACGTVQAIATAAITGTAVITLCGSTAGALGGDTIQGMAADSVAVVGNPLLMGANQAGNARTLGAVVPSVDTIGQSGNVHLATYSVQACLNTTTNQFERARIANSAAGSTGTGLLGIGNLVFDGTNWQKQLSDASGNSFMRLGQGSATGTLTNVNDAVTLTTSNGASQVLVQFEGVTPVLVVAFEVSSNGGANWRQAFAFLRPLGISGGNQGAISVANPAAGTQYLIMADGSAQVRVRASSVTSGSITCTLVNQTVGGPSISMMAGQGTSLVPQICNISSQNNDTGGQNAQFALAANSLMFSLGVGNVLERSRTANFAAATTGTGLMGVAIMGKSAATTNYDNLAMIRDAGDAGSPSFALATGVLSFNGVNYDRTRNNTDITLLTSLGRTITSTSADIINYNACGLNVILNVTVNGAGGSITLTVDGKDAASGAYYNLITGAAITAAATGTFVYRIQPGLTAVANTTVNDRCPRTFRIVVTANNANSVTYSLGYSTIVN